MKRKKLLHIIEWAIAIAAMTYLAYRLATYDDYASLASGLRDLGGLQWSALVLCIALMPVNMLLEAWKWRTLMCGSIRSDDPPMTLKEAQWQVYYSKLAGLITPWRLGEYPARGLLMAKQGKRCMRQVLSMGVVGSATMTFAIVSVGLIALAFSPLILSFLGNNYLYTLAAVILVLAVGLYFSPQWLRRYAELEKRELWISLLQSYARLACWCVQLALVIYALSPNSLQLNLIDIPIYYLLVTITPNVPVVEVGVRGVWAILVFKTPGAAIAGVLLWMINTLLPCLVSIGGIRRK